MTLGDLPPTQLYASMAFVLSVATLWLSRLKEDPNALDFIQRNVHAVKAVVSVLLTWPIMHVLYVLVAHSTASSGHQIAHAVPLAGSMFAIIGWWIRTLAVAPTVKEKDSASP